MGINTETGFIEYRYLHSKHYEFQTPALTFKFNVNQGDATVVVAWAVCSEKDNFSRAVGRKFVDERMDEGKTIKVAYDRSKSLVDNAIDGMNKLVIAYETDQEFRDSVAGNQNQKTLFSEIKRAVMAFIEVKSCTEFHDMCRDFTVDEDSI